MFILYRTIECECDVRTAHGRKIVGGGAKAHLTKLFI